MANPRPKQENLKPFKKNDPSTVDIQRKGGINSGKAKREYREMSDFLREFINSEYTAEDGKKIEIRELFNKSWLKVLVSGGASVVSLTKAIVDTEIKKVQVTTANETELTRLLKAITPEDIERVKKMRDDG